jgi:hypothetical protein
VSKEYAWTSGERQRIILQEQIAAGFYLHTSWRNLCGRTFRNNKGKNLP